HVVLAALGIQCMNRRCKELLARAGVAANQHWQIAQAAESHRLTKGVLERGTVADDAVLPGKIAQALLFVALVAECRECVSERRGQRGGKTRAAIVEQRPRAGE